MTTTLSTGLRFGAACLVAAACQLGTTGLAQAQQAPVMPPANAPPGAAPPAAETAAAPAGPTAMTTPAMAGPLAANPDPIHFDAVPAGTVYMTGALSGLLLTQTDPILGDRSTTVDLSNAQVTLQNTDGWFQFFLEPGAYSLPTLGTSYKAFSVGPATNLYGGLPVAWGKIVPTDTFSIQGGQLPTLIGAEGMFTFQNMNIERGLLWAQEPVVSHGVQANLTTGPVAWSASVNDGYYSGQYNWLTGSATWTIDPANTLVISGGGAIGRNTAPGTFATPVAQNNSQIVEAGYTYGNAPWTITPYVQYTHVGADSRLGIVNDSSTIGAAVLANYKFTDTISLAGRFEYIDSSGAATGAGLLGYGPGSSAMSFTLTPTWQSGIYFVRGEGSYVSLSHTAPGFAFGNGGNSKSQGRFMLETGIVF